MFLFDLLSMELSCVANELFLNQCPSVSAGVLSRGILYLCAMSSKDDDTERRFKRGAERIQARGEEARTNSAIEWRSLCRMVYTHEGLMLRYDSDPSELYIIVRTLVGMSVTLEHLLCKLIRVSLHVCMCVALSPSFSLAPSLSLSQREREGGREGGREGVQGLSISLSSINTHWKLTLSTCDFLLYTSYPYTEKAAHAKRTAAQGCADWHRGCGCVPAQTPCLRQEGRTVPHTAPSAMEPANAPSALDEDTGAVYYASCQNFLEGGPRTSPGIESLHIQQPHRFQLDSSIIHNRGVLQIRFIQIPFE